MIRKPPLKTYQKKKTGQSSFCYSQLSLWEPRSFSKKISTNDKKKKITPTRDGTDIEDLSFLETTFDRMAKNAKLPPLPQQESYDSINISSDVPIDEPSPIKTDIYECPWAREPVKSKACKRARRKPVQSRPVYVVSEVVVKKRLKHDLINTSTKKDKAVRSSRRKVSAKAGKNGTNSKEKQEVNHHGLTMSDVKDLFVEQPENRKKEKNGYLLRATKKVNRISYSSSSDSDSGWNYDVDVNKVEVKSKKKNILGGRNTSAEKLKVLDSIDTSLRELNDVTKFQVVDKDGEEKDFKESQDKKSSLVDSCHYVNTSKVSAVSYRTRSRAANRNCPALDYVKNFQRYSASKLGESTDSNPMGSNKRNRILTRKQYLTQIQSKLTKKNNAQKPTTDACVDNLDNLDNSENEDAGDKDSPVKPCSVLLLKCNENINPIVNEKKSMVASHHCNMYNSEDLFQSSISNITSTIEPESSEDIKMRLHKSAGSQQAQSVENLSDFPSNMDLDIKPSEMKIFKENIEKKLQRCDYSKCSTPINAHVKINDTINYLSPIITSKDTLQENGRFIGLKEAHKSSATNCSTNNISSGKECSEFLKPNMRRRSARKRLSISYEEDKSLELSNEYCKKTETEKIHVEHIENCEYSSRLSDAEEVQCPTSQIQESLEILKLNLENSINKCSKDEKGRARLSRKEIVSTDSSGSNKLFEATNKHHYTNEFTGQSKDSCSQLTPIGIITTRSGRQLKLSTTTQRKFFNDSNDSEIRSDADNEIIDDSETTKSRSLRSGITKHRGSRFTILRSHSKNFTPDHVKSSNSMDIFTAYENGCAEIQPAVNTANTLTSNNSISRESTNFIASSELKTMSLSSDSKCSAQGSGKESGFNYSTSYLGDERNNTGTSVAADPQNEYTASIDQEILQSILESTENLHSLNITSRVEVKTETPSCTVSNDDDSDSEWSTLSNNGNLDLRTGNLGEEIKEEPHDENKLTNSLLSSSGCMLISDQNELDNDLSIEASDNTSKSRQDLSPRYTKMPLMDRLKLLSTRINTRKRRKTFLKPAAENISEVFEAQTGIQTFDNSKMENSFKVCSSNGFDLEENNDIENAANSLGEAKDSDSIIPPLHVNLNENLQPLVLLERLEDPLRITANERQDRSLKVTTIHKNSNKTLRTISKNSNDSFTSSYNEVDKDDENFEKSDPLYCPPELCGTDNSSFNANVISALDSNCHFSKLSVSTSEIMDRKSLLVALERCILKRSKKENSSFKANQSLFRRSRKKQSLRSNATSASECNCSDSKLDRSESEISGRQSLFLKPGKEWARSLSILNNIQNGSDLEQLSTGKGKNWRQSVQTIFAMQEEGLIQSCLGKNKNDKDVQPRFRALNCTTNPDTTPCLEEQSVGSASPSRFIRRMSIRVVPEKKRLSHIKDTSFLEAYGITPSKSRKTLSRRSSEFESVEKTLTDNVQCEDAAIETVTTERIITARDVVLQKCSQDDYLPFTECFPIEYLWNCRKIGEGVYGEVFLHERRRQKSVIKIIPIEGEALVNGERQKRFDEILSEIVIAKELHDLRYGDKYQTHGFVEVKNIRCIRGKYPEKLIELWKAYDNDKGSDNDCPSMFDQDQLYIVLELGHGGEDLEAFVFHSAVEAHALFVQAAAALAVAEQSLEFEHRDLHWGNILISETKNSEATYTLNNKEYTYPTKGLQVAIIDFTLSRMSYDGCCIFNDLALDPALFTAQGEYQFEIYRLMRDKIGNNWQEFEPYTNVLWLHYTIDKMMTSARYKRKYAKGHREAMFQLHELKEVILNYNSAFDFVTNCEKITSLQCNIKSEIDEKPIIIESRNRR